MKTVIHALAAFAGAVTGIIIISKIAFNKSEIEDTAVDVENEHVDEDIIRKYYFSVMGIKAKGARAYTSITHVVNGNYPSEASIEQVRQKVMAHNPDFKDCVVLSYMPISM